MPLALLITLLGLLWLPLPARAEVPATLWHWWVSPGEQASIAVIRRHVQAAGLRWQARALPGSGTRRYMDVLRAEVEAGRPPLASQVIGYDIHDWARQGRLHNLDAIAEEQGWAEVVPYAIQHLSKYQGHWVAAPINAHSTNWLWVNQALFSRLGRPVPDDWGDLLQLLEAARDAGITPLAIGHEPWEQTLLFEVVAAGAGGAEYYRRAFIELDAQVLDWPLLERIFQRMSQLRGYLPANFRQQRWDQATGQVRRGEALLQVQGSWVAGEFTAHGLLPGRDYLCLRFPDTQGLFLFNSDQYIFFKDHPAPADSLRTLARTLMGVQLQTELNIASGAAPARVDVPREAFNSCNQSAISDLRSANMRRALLGSIAMGNANPAAAKQAIYQVVNDHLLGRLSDDQAAITLRQTLARYREQQP